MQKGHNVYFRGIAGSGKSFVKSTASLNGQQQLIVDLMEKGHNVYFRGIAGSGKTFVKKHILNVLNRTPRNLTCTCTTSIACTLY